MKKIIVLGASGMAGHLIQTYLSTKTDKYNVIGMVNSTELNLKNIKCDVIDLKDFITKIEMFNPDIIINCIGILNTSSMIDVAKTTYINTFFPKYLENKYKNSNTKIIHLSTDCVFDGKYGGYKENSFKNDQTIYGMSKNFGEIINDKDLTIRTSIIGPEIKDGTGLFNWFMKQEGVVSGYSNVFWTGVTTLELAKAINEFIEQDVTGLYQLVPENKISKYDLLKLVKDIFNKNKITLIENREYFSDKSLIDTRKDFKYNVKSYEDMIIEMRDWLRENKMLYEMMTHYF